MKYIPRGIPCLIVTVCLFGYLSLVMGFTNMLNTIMRTAHDLLLNTVFYLMAMCVLTGALSRIFSVFGVVDLLQKMLKPVLRPLFNLPGVSSAGALMTFLSDKPVIISVAKNPLFARYFKRYQHIIDPRTGWPSDSGIVSATVIADSSLQADMLATTTCLAGSEGFFELALRHPDCDFIAILADGTVLRSA